MRRVLLFLVLVSGLALGQGARFDSVAQTTTTIGAGTVIVLVPMAAASITVCAYPATGGFPCTNKVSLCTDITITSCSTANNPVVADAQGNFGFWVASGSYQYSICPQTGPCVQQYYNAVLATGSSTPVGAVLITPSGVQTVQSSVDSSLVIQGANVSVPTQPIFQIQDKTGANIWQANPDGSVTVGSGTGGTANGLLEIGSGVATNTDLVGKITLSAGNGSRNFTQTYASAPSCFFRDITTPANAVTTQTVSTTAITLVGTGSDVIGYICIALN